MFVVHVNPEDERGRRYIKGYYLATKRRYDQTHKDDPAYAYVSQKDLMGTTALSHFIEHYKAYYVQDNKLVLDTTK